MSATLAPATTELRGPSFPQTIRPQGEWCKRESTGLPGLPAAAAALLLTALLALGAPAAFAQQEGEDDADTAAAEALEEQALEAEITAPPAAPEAQEAEATEEAAEAAAQVPEITEESPPPPAAADEAPPADPTAALDFGDDEVEEIVVTGSRIRRDTFNSSLPVQVITADRAVLAGMADAGEFLQRSSLAQGVQIDNSFGGFVTAGGQGANTFGLLGLGPGRTLVLVNGRRFTPAGTRGEVASFDFNTIPNVAIERIEILKDGASSIYGADAVAGVINIITRKQYDDLLMEANWRDEFDRHDISVAYGKTFDRGFFDFAFQYSHQGAIKRNERDWAECDVRPLADGTQQNSIWPGTRPDDPSDIIRERGVTPATGPCFGGQFSYVEVIGFPFWALYDEASTGFHGSNLPFRPLPLQTRQPAARRNNGDWSIENLFGRENTISIYSDGQYDFDLDKVEGLGALGDFIGTVTASYEFYYNERQNSSRGGYRYFFPDVSLRNPTNEVGRVLGQLSSSITSSQPVIIGFEMLDTNSEVDVAVTGLRGGLKGDTGLFNWDLNVGYTFSRGEYRYETFLKDRVTRGLSSEMVNGELRCAIDQEQLRIAAGPGEADQVARIIAEGPDPNCVPLNLFTGDALVYGRLTPAERAYITRHVIGKTNYDLLTLNFGVEGALFSMPAGEVRAAAGVEFRSRELDDMPPAESANDNQWGLTSAGPTKGDDNVKEAYGEVEFPLAAGYKIGEISIAEELRLNLSWRLTDYSSYGSDDTYRITMNWGINPAMRMRSSFGTSFRAPSLYELNLENQTGFAAARNDPCSGWEDRDDLSNNERSNCAHLENAGIIPEDFSSSSLQITTGGNKNLQAETSESFTLGVVLTPDINQTLPGLGLDINFAVDYYNLELDNSITSLSAGTIISRCYESPVPGPGSNVTERFTAVECGLLGSGMVGGDGSSHRGANGVIYNVNSSIINIARETVNGLTFTVRADREFEIGDLSVDFQMARQASRNFQLLAGETPTQYIDHHANPKWRGELDLDFDWKDYSFTWFIDYIGSTDEIPVTLGNTTRLHKADRAFYNGVVVRYTDPKDRFLLSFGVANIFDVEPPVLGAFSNSLTTNISYNIPLGAGYDLHPRRAYIGFQYKLAELFPGLF